MILSVLSSFHDLSHCVSEFQISMGLSLTKITVIGFGTHPTARMIFNLNLQKSPFFFFFKINTYSQVQEVRALTFVFSVPPYNLLQMETHERFKITSDSQKNSISSFNLDLVSYIVEISPAVLAIGHLRFIYLFNFFQINQPFMNFDYF